MTPAGSICRNSLRNGGLTTVTCSGMIGGQQDERQANVECHHYEGGGEGRGGQRHRLESLAQLKWTAWGLCKGAPVAGAWTGSCFAFTLATERHPLRTFTLASMQSQESPSQSTMPRRRSAMSIRKNISLQSWASLT